MTASGIETIDYGAADAAERFCDSVHRTGFAVLRGHPLEGELPARMSAGWREFFAGTAKFEFAAGGDGPSGSPHGYFSLEVSERALGQSRRDLKEFFDAGPGADLPGHLADDVFRYRALGLDVGRALLGWLDQALPHECRYDPGLRLAEALADADSLLRILHYPPLTGAEHAGSVRAAAHEDINFLTLLPVSEHAGLQILDRAGAWIDPGGGSGELIVNTGDMLQEFTRGYLPSTTHRVINPGTGAANVSRLSLPFFLTPRLDLRLSARYTAGEYLAERLTQIDGRVAG